MEGGASAELLSKRLYDAAYAGVLHGPTGALELLRAGADPNWRLHSGAGRAGGGLGGRGPLHRAAALGHARLCAALLRHGADPLLRAHDGFTPLHECVRLSQTECVGTLLDAAAATGGATPRQLLCAVNDAHETALHCAAAVRMYRPAGADDRWETVTSRDAVERAPDCEERRCAALLLRACERFGCGFVLDAPDRKRRRPLHCAAAADRWDVVEALLLAGADARAQDEQGNTALHAAVEVLGVRSADVLLRRDRALLRLRNDRGETPMLCAALAMGRAMMATPDALLTLAAYGGSAADARADGCSVGDALLALPPAQGAALAAELRFPASRRLALWAWREANAAAAAEEEIRATLRARERRSGGGGGGGAADDGNGEGEGGGECGEEAPEDATVDAVDVVRMIPVEIMAVVISFL